MRKVQTLMAIAGLLFSQTARPQIKEPTGARKIEPLPRELEVQLALSAA